MKTALSKLMATLCTGALIFPASVFAQNSQFEKVSRRLEQGGQAMIAHGAHFSFSPTFNGQNETRLQMADIARAENTKALYTLLPASADLSGQQIGIKIHRTRTIENTRLLTVEFAAYDAQSKTLVAFQPAIQRTIEINLATSDLSQVSVQLNQATSSMYANVKTRLYSALSPSQKIKSSLMSFANSVMPSAQADGDTIWGYVLYGTGFVLAIDAFFLYKSAKDILLNNRSGFSKPVLITTIIIGLAGVLIGGKAYKVMMGDAYGPNGISEDE